MWNDLSGDRYGRWLVLECTGRSGEMTGKMHGQTMWRCRCDCGREKVGVVYSALVKGVSTSCGCYRGEVLGGRAKKHGDSQCKAYRAWQQAKDRCFNKTRHTWEGYGGHGITMCEGFRGSYPAWRDALGPAPSVKHSVDRRDNEGHYSCGLCCQCVDNRWKFNIRWATREEQNHNRRCTRRMPWGGKRMSLTQIARAEDVAYCSFRNLIHDGKSVTAAIAHCRSRGLRFTERAKCMMNPS